MTLQQLKEPLAMLPFRPFLVHTDEGGDEPVLLIDSAEHTRFTRDGSALVHFSPGGAVIVIDLKHITKLTHFIPQPVSQNGDHEEDPTP